MQNPPDIAELLSTHSLEMTVGEGKESIHVTINAGRAVKRILEDLKDLKPIRDTEYGKFERDQC